MGVDEDVFDSVSLKVDNTRSLNIGELFERCRDNPSLIRWLVIGFVEKSTIAKKEITRIEMIGFDAK